MPYVYWDDVKRRHYMFRKKPKELQSILGKAPWTYKFKQSVGEAEANDLSIDINRTWDDEIRHARAASDPVALAHLMIDREVATLPTLQQAAIEKFVSMLGSQLVVAEASAKLGLTYGDVPIAGKPLEMADREVEASFQPQHDRISGLAAAILAKLAKPEPVVETKPGMKVVPVHTEDSIRLWRDWRGDAQPTQDAISGRRNKMRDFFAWVRTRHEVVGGDDLTQCTADDVQDYKEYLVTTYGRKSNVPRDRMIDVLACFNIADDNGKFRGLKDGNPAAKVTTPPKRKGVPRPAFTDDTADYIMDEAMKRRENPLIFYGVPLQRFHGAIISEFADAKARHVKLVDGIYCIEFTPEGRTTIVEGEVQARGLKTHARHRGLPLHAWFLRNGFVERAQRLLEAYGPDAPLFPEIRINKQGERRTKASDDMIDFLRGIGIENKLDPQTITINPKTGKKTGTVIEMWDSYNWRHYLGTKLQAVAASATPERRRYMTGHAGVDVHENIYVEHPPEELKPYIDALPDFDPAEYASRKAIGAEAA